MSLAPGSTLGPYAIQAELGHGGMGVVYRAQDPRLKRQVAIKLLPPDLTRDETAKQRFLQEAQAASALDHPNICTIHEINETEDGQLYLVMAHYEGETLKQRIERGPLGLDDAIDIATQVGQGLAEAHGAGIVHRDIKPANLLVTKSGAVKILDFGLAKLAGTEGVTQTGTAVGTVAYMSPEQSRGQEVDHRTDIWSLGVVLHEMVAGRPPFQREQGDAVVHAILRETPTALTGLRTGVPMDLERIVTRAMSKPADDRYQTVADLLSELRGVKRTLQEGATAGEQRAPSIAVLPFTNMSPDPENEFFADGISEDIINTLGQIEGLRVAARGSAFFFKGKHVDLRDVGQKLHVSTVLEGSVRKAGKRLRITAELVNAKDGYQLWSERYDRELADIFEIQDEIARTIADRLEVTLTGGKHAPLAKRATDNLNAYQAYLKGRGLLYKRGRSILDALTCFEEAVALDPDYALAWAGLADGRSVLGYYGMVAPHEAMPQAKEAAARAVQLDDSLAEAHCAFALATLLHDFDVPTARREFRRAMELNPKYPQAAAWFALFVLAFIDGQFDEGIALMTPIVEQDPLSGYNRAVQAWLLAFSGRYDEGVAEALAAVELDPDAFFSHWILQCNYTLAGRYPEAVAAGHAALAVSGRQPIAMFTMATTYANWGKRTEARALHDELMTRADSQWVSPAVLAHHFYQAGAVADADKALHYLTLAATQAAAASAFEDAVAFSTTALSFERLDERARADLMYERGGALRSLAQAEDAIADWKFALSAYEALGDAAAVARTAWDLGWILLWQDRGADALAVRGAGFTGHQAEVAFDLMGAAKAPGLIEGRDKRRRDDWADPGGGGQPLHHRVGRRGLGELGISGGQLLGQVRPQGQQRVERHLQLVRELELPHIRAEPVGIPGSDAQPLAAHQRAHEREGAPAGSYQQVAHPELPPHLPLRGRDPMRRTI